MTPKEALLNTKGAATTLKCSENWVHKLVQHGRLKAYVYNDEGVLVEREKQPKRQGQGLYFYEKDLKAYKRRGRGRPQGSKNSRQMKEAA